MFELTYARSGGEMVVINVETLELGCILSKVQGGQVVALERERV
jgi:hypothetical protein